jgi:hypothetical protein
VADELGVAPATSPSAAPSGSAGAPPAPVPSASVSTGAKPR